MDNSIEYRVKNVLSSVFGKEITEIGDDASPHSIDTWDSIKHINMVIALEEEFGIECDADEVASMVSCAIIVATVKAYLD